MGCSQCAGIEKQFDRKMAARDLKRYRKNGPVKSTRILLDALREKNVRGMTVLDIGGGIGAIQQELLKAGATQASDADASSAYLEAAREEAIRQGNVEQIQFYHGDFVDLAPEIHPADIVTLDRMICCYPDAHAILHFATEKAIKFLGLTYPRETFLMKSATPIMNALFALSKNPFRLFLHQTEAIDTEIQKGGLEKTFYGKTFLWHVVLYERI